MSKVHSQARTTPRIRYTLPYWARGILHLWKTGSSTGRRRAEYKKKRGSPGRIRTSDPTVNSRLLCQLSYWGRSKSAVGF